MFQWYVGMFLDRWWLNCSCFLLKFHPAMFGGNELGGCCFFQIGWFNHQLEGSIDETVIFIMFCETKCCFSRRSWIRLPLEMFVPLQGDELVDFRGLGSSISYPAKVHREREVGLMEEILHQWICTLSHCLQGFIHPKWCRISSINSISYIGKNDCPLPC